MTATLVAKDALNDETAHAVERVAGEMFELRLLGDARSFDMSAIGVPLVYQAYFNGTMVPEGFLIPRKAMTEPEVLDACRELFQGHIAAGRTVIVWRALPVFRCDVDFEKGETNYYVRFRCAFVTPHDLKPVKAAVQQAEDEAERAADAQADRDAHG